ncbi:MAG: patatin-like phospholipase family protein [Gammaproteobacteria bacterium]|nr:MAG: patatin-like phospholipase family protein [Gammaproteobacteria bacterium]
MATRKKSSTRKAINLALQGGGAHGAFAWGALDTLLADGRIDIEAISATSAGAMNAVVLADALSDGDREHARERLSAFWRAIANAGAKYSPVKPLRDWSGRALPVEQSPFYWMFDTMTRLFSPYQLNPLNFNPLREVLEQQVDFEKLRKTRGINVHLCATNVETGRVRIFNRDELTPDTVLASACLPLLFQTIEIDGAHYWDGGYIGNPAIFPLIYGSQSRDVVIIHINPIVRPGIPKTAPEILNRINEISFNSSLMREMRAIAFVTRLIQSKKVKASEMKQMLIHSIRDDEAMTAHSVASKLSPDWDFLCQLKDSGGAVTERWLRTHFDDLGQRSSVDLEAEFL